MWILPSRGRPFNVERLAKAWVKTGASTPVLLRLDRDDPSLEDYASIALPEGWRAYAGPRPTTLAEIYNSTFWRAKKGPSWWGFIGDDCVPETPGWDKALIETAGSDAMAVPAGGHDPAGAPHFVLGSDLPQNMGWLALPGLSRLYIDTVWQVIAQEKGRLKRRPDVVLKHHHFSNGLALLDSTYRKPRKTQDRAIFEAWLAQRKADNG